MSQPVRFRHVNEIVGAFVLLTLALLVAGILAAGRAQRWFERHEEVRTRFPADGTFGLQRGAEVHILGTPVGTVRSIEVEDDGRMNGLLRIRGEFARFIREDSEAIIRKKFGIAGDAYMDITVGSGPPLELAPGAYLPSRKDTELTELAEEMLDQIRIAIVPALVELENLLAAYRRLAERFEAPESDLQRAIGRVESLLAGMERGEGAVGRLLRDPAPVDQLEGILRQVADRLDEMGAILGRIQSILDDTGRAAAVLPGVAETVRGEMRDVPGLTLQARATLRETEALLAGAQRHWLLRRYIEREDPLTAVSIHELPPPMEISR